MIRARAAMYRDALAQHGYDVVAVKDGQDALRWAEQAIPMAVVLDLMLPRVGGYDVYKDLRANPATNRLPIIIITGADTRNLEPTDVSSFLRKPIDATALVTAVERALRQPA